MTPRVNQAKPLQSPEIAMATRQDMTDFNEYLRIFHDVPCITLNRIYLDVEVASSRADVTQFAILMFFWAPLLN